jgi:phosphonate transport system substrate-binding protein
MLAIQHPELTAQTRIVRASDEHGFPPFVAAKSAAPDEVELLRQTLIGMPRDAEGAKLLAQLRLDGFVAGEDRLFDSIAAMMRAAVER